MRGSTSACRLCHARFITATEGDGRILILDGDAPLDPMGKNPVRLLEVIEPVTRSGYRVEPPEHLGIFDRGTQRTEPADDPVGLSDEELRTSVITLDADRILRRPDGSPRSPAEAARFVGWRAVWVAQLNEALRERLAGPPPLSFPPGIFVSYRWGNPAENEWTAGLARQLKARGYPVIFDRDKPSDLDVPEMVSKIADCRYFLAILDSGYAERLGDSEGKTKDGWVFDEYNTAAFISNQKQIRIVGLLREGSELPGGFRHPAPGRPGNTVDVRTPEQLACVLDDVLPPIENAPDEDTVQRARALLRESHERLCAQRFEDAFAMAEELSALLPGIIDGPAQKVRVALQAGWSEKGLASAEDALNLAPRSRELRLAAGTFAIRAGNHQRAIEHFATLLETHGDEEAPDVARARHSLGSSLDDVGQVYPAIAHLELARRMVAPDPGVHNTLGFVYRRAGELHKAVECFAERLRNDPEDVDLLVNLTAALLEFGRFPEARVAFNRLVECAPENPSIVGLRNYLEEAGDVAQERVQLVVKVLTSEMSLWIKCTKCEARVPIDAKGGALCARCGSSLPPKPGACSYCKADGRVFPGLKTGSAFLCPYCRRGQISVVGAE
jgi:Flp pilus assembly protein TadD